MTARKRDTSLGTGTYFAPGDYVGIMRRLVILAVDLAVLVVLYFVFIIGFFVVLGDEGDGGGWFMLTYAASVWLYMTLLKASKVRTVGYWLADARIVDLRGKRPSIFRMTLRAMLWVLGPFNLLFDLLWAGIDEDRQSLRDRFAGTCIIRHRAESIGTAEIHLMHYNAGGFALKYARVMRPKNANTASEPANTQTA